MKPVLSIGSMAQISYTVKQIAMIHSFSDRNRGKAPSPQHQSMREKSQCLLTYLHLRIHKVSYQLALHYAVKSTVDCCQLFSKNKTKAIDLPFCSKAKRRSDTFFTMIPRVNGRVDPLTVPANGDEANFQKYSQSNLVIFMGKVEFYNL
jgi:hypothetical protein